MSFLNSPPGETPQQNLLFVNFNQDSTSLQTGSKNGFKLYPLNSVDTLEFTHENNERPNINLVERLFSSSLVALVSSDHPRKLDVCHFKKGSEICNYSYSNAILAVKLNRMRLVVCLEESLYIHNIRDMKVLHTIRDTPPNPRGVCAMSPHNDHAYLAYPGSAQAGEVQIFDTITLRAVINISAHDNPLAALAFNQQGTRLATASEKGTVIRVFSLPDGEKLFEFRRGIKRCVDTQCLAFSYDSLFLCLCSNTETVHIFKLEETKENPVLAVVGDILNPTGSTRPQEDNTWTGMLTNTFKSSANYLPTGITDVMNQGRSFATARLPSGGLKSVCTITALQKVPRLLVATHEGHLYIYNLDPVEGGECTLLRTHTLEGQGLEHQSPGDEVNCDRPLTAGSGLAQGAHGADTPASSYAARAGGHLGSGAAPSGHPLGNPASGKPGHHHQLSSPAGGQWHRGKNGSAGGSFADMLKGKSDLPPVPPKELTVEDNIQSVMEELDSLPYQEPLDGAVGGEDAIGALRINDNSEFPPMS